MDWADFVGLAGVPFLIGIVEVIKQAAGEALPTRFVPTLAVFLGVVLNVLAALWLHNDPALASIIGATAGLAACKLYEYGALRSQ